LLNRKKPISKMRKAEETSAKIRGKSKEEGEKFVGAFTKSKWTGKKTREENKPGFREKKSPERMALENKKNFCEWKGD